MRKFLTMAAGCCLLVACNNSKPASESAAPSSDSAMTTKETKTMPTEIADAKYMDMGKKGLSQLSSGDIDGWMTAYADNAVYHWSAGDSLAGKAAISKYWKERRTKIIDSINFTNDIWLPVKVNQPQRGPDAPGIWLFGWYQVNVKYKNGKKLKFWVHTDYHYDSNDKIDNVVTFIDRAPINKALGVK